MKPQILRLNKAGQPVEWLTKEGAATLHAKDRIIWAYNGNTIIMRGGYDHNGHQTLIELPTILASDGDVHFARFAPPLNNHFLFRRDSFICLYCGKSFKAEYLSRDHVVPKSQNGLDTWKNVVTACKKCNQRKADRTPEQAGMELLAIPFEPNKYEFLYLANRHILADQMEFLKTSFSGNKCWS